MAPGQDASKNGVQTRPRIIFDGCSYQEASGLFGFLFRCELGKFESATCDTADVYRSSDKLRGST